MALKMLGALQLGDPMAREFAAYGCRGGLNVLDPPQEVGDEDLTMALDGYLVATGTGLGGFLQRNGMSAYNTNQSAGKSLILARFYQDVQNGAVVSPETVVLLGQIGNTLYSVPSGSGPLVSLGTIGTTASPMTWARIQNPNDPHFASGLTYCMAICTGSGGPYVYDGTNLYTPVGWANAASAAYCAVVNGILWFGGIPAAPNQIFGAGDGITASMETLPGYRNLALTSPVTGLCAAGSGPNASLVVGMNSGLTTLYGTGPNTFYRQDMSFGDGVIAGRTMVSPDGTVFFLGHNGLYRFDLTTVPSLLSKKLDPWFLNSQFLPTTAYPMTSRVGAWGCVYNNRYHLGYCSNSSTPNVILCLDLVVGGWTLLRPNNGAASMIVLDAPSDPNPYVALIGSSTQAQAMNWDFVPSDPTKPAYDDAPTNSVAVLAQVLGKSFRLGVPGSTKVLQRYYPELFITGPFTAYAVVNVDSGAAIAQDTLTSSGLSGGGGTWDSSSWDNAAWGGTSAFVRFGPPATRCDYSLQGSEFAFGIQTTSAQPPWLWTGGTGVYAQQGRP